MRLFLLLCFVMWSCILCAVLRDAYAWFFDAPPFLPQWAYVWIAFVHCVMGLARQYKALFPTKA